MNNQNEVKKYHIAYCGLDGAIYCEAVRWIDLGWTTGRKLTVAASNLLRRNNITISAVEALDRGRIKVIETQAIPDIVGKTYNNSRLALKRRLRKDKDLKTIGTRSCKGWNF